MLIDLDLIKTYNLEVYELLIVLGVKAINALKYSMLFTIVL